MLCLVVLGIGILNWEREVMYELSSWSDAHNVQVEIIGAIS